ncbi:MAG: hypothetical protein U0931_00725 [Vulcanimicrobiota bacterium]
MAELAQMYGREGEALERYQAVRMGDSRPMPEDCDLCGARLNGSEMAPQTIQWRTKERTVGKEHRLLVTIEKRSWQQTSGTYYLCQGCRKVMRPPLLGALSKALLPAILLVPLFIWMGGEDQPMAISLMFPALVCGAGLWFFMRSRFRGYPASMGFRIHETTFDGPEQRLVQPVFILVTLCFLFAGLYGGGGPPVNQQLARLDGKGGTGTVNMAAVDEALKGFYEVVEGGQRKASESLVKGWVQHAQRSPHFYPRSPQFTQAVTDLIRTKKMKTAEAVEIITAETGGKRLVRLQGDGDPTALQVKVGRLASLIGGSQWDAAQAAEKVAETLNAISHPKKYDVILDALIKQAESGRGKSLEDLSQQAQSELTR